MLELSAGVVMSLTMWWVFRLQNTKEGKPINSGWFLCPVFGLLVYLLLISGGWATFLGWVLFILFMAGAHGIWAGTREKPKANSSTGMERRAFDVIRFEYKGREDFAHLQRTVEVTGMDKTYFEGMCRARQSERTFRFDRVRGEVVSMETGEIYPSAAEWRDEYIDDPRNRGVSPVPNDAWKRDR